MTLDGGAGRGMQISGNPMFETAAQRRANCCEIGKNGFLGKGDGHRNAEVPSVVADRYFQAGAVTVKTGPAARRGAADSVWEGLVG